MVEPQGQIRKFDHHTTDKAIAVLWYDAHSGGKAWSARPYKPKACQMAIEALQRMKEAMK